MSKRWTSLLVSALLLVGCGVGEGTGSTPPWAEAETPTATTVDENPPEPIDPFRVRFETTKGDVLIDVHPEWAPRGARRFRDLVEAGFYEDNRIFRVRPGFVVQFGMHGDPEVNRKWADEPILDDPIQQSNYRGYVTFATSGNDGRTSQVFINLSHNMSLDTMAESFAPFGEVVEGMDVVDSFESKYGEAPSDKQPRIRAGGNAFLDKEFPGLDSIIRATIVEDAASAPALEDAEPAPSKSDAREGDAQEDTGTEDDAASQDEAVP